MSPFNIPQIERGLQKHRARLVRPSDGLSWASVALVLRPDEDEIELLFIRRSQNKGDPWSGHMAFPGGRQEPSDRDLAETAVRETHEEVGLDLRQRGSFLGSLDDLVSPLKEGRSSLVIRPQVYVCRHPGTLRLSDEVDQTFWFSLQVLASPERRETMSYAWKGSDIELPVVRVGEADIWGLSLRMLDSFFEVIAQC
jgi:8-oxo-dGTP pyrophosphatase MutT (NUDIX family)